MMEAIIGRCKGCDIVICVCNDCLNRHGELCDSCHRNLMLSHNPPQQQEGKKRLYEPEPIPLARAKD